MPFTKKPSVTSIIIVLCLLGILILNLKFKDVFSPTNIPAAEIDKSCQLHKSKCTLELPGGGEVTVNIEPKPIPLTTPIQLSVNVKGRQFSHVEVDFSGVDMNMGFNRTKLSEQSASSFFGEMILPVCIQNKMEWEAKVVLHGGEGSLLAPFRFFTFKF